MASLGQVAKRAGVSSTAVRKWLQRENLDQTCWDKSKRGYQISSDIEKQIIAYYQGKRAVNEDVTSSQELVTELREEVSYLREQNRELMRSNSEMVSTLQTAYEALSDAQRRLEASQTLQAHTQGLIGAQKPFQQATGAQESPPTQAQRGFVRDFVTRLASRRKQ